MVPAQKKVRVDIPIEEATPFFLGSTASDSENDTDSADADTSDNETVVSVEKADAGPEDENETVSDDSETSSGSPQYTSRETDEDKLNKSSENISISEYVFSKADMEKIEEAVVSNLDLTDLDPDFSTDNTSVIKNEKLDAGREILARDDYVKAEKYFIHLIRDTDDDRVKAFGCLYLGKAKFFQGKYREALYFFYRIDKRSSEAEFWINKTFEKLY